MASIQMTRDQAADPSLWPPLCVFCGKPSTQLVEVPSRHREGQESWRVPVCGGHTRGWRRREAFIIVVFLLPIWLVLTAIGLCLWGSPWSWEAIFGAAFIGGFLTAIGGISLATWLQPVCVIDQSDAIIYQNLSRHFAHAWHADQESASGEREHETGPASELSLGEIEEEFDFLFQHYFVGGMMLIAFSTAVITLAAINPSGLMILVALMVGFISVFMVGILTKCVARMMIVQNTAPNFRVRLVWICSAALSGGVDGTKRHARIQAMLQRRFELLQIQKLP